MRTNIKRIILVSISAVLALAPSITLAGNNSGARSISYFKVDKNRITIYAANGTTFVDDSACTGTNASEVVVVSTARDEFKELYAAVLVAHANNRQVAFWLDGACSPAAAGGPYPTVEMVYVY